jgi:outer membrane receptor protein involved in Fe transport
LQQGIFVPACGINIYQNAGKAFSKGIELQMAALLTEGVTAGVGADYLKSRITQSDVFGLPVGTPFTLAPKYKVAADLTYRRPLPLADGRWSLFGRADFSYQDKTLFDFNNNIGSVQPAYQTLNLRLGLMSRRLDLVAFADNVTDEKAVLFDSSLANGFPVPLGTNNRRIRPLRPPTFGLMITLRY